MAGESSGTYLPGDPRYGLSGEDLKNYYRSKPAQWAIYCWDKDGAGDLRSQTLAAQQAFVAGFGERVVGYGHLISDDGAKTLGTTFFMQLNDRAAADQFVADEPLNQAGVYDRVEVHRWSNSFLKRQADYQRKGMQQFLCMGKKADDPQLLATHLHDHESYFAEYGNSFIFRGPIRSADGTENIGTALLLELPGRAAADEFWTNEPFAANGLYAPGYRICRWTFGD